MSLGAAVRLYALTACVFFAIDVVWIAVVANGFYRRHLGHLLRAEVLWTPAALFYGIYIAGILVFAVMPGLDAGSLQRTAALGAFLGLFAYATFDLTSMALLNDFPLRVVAVDLLWGTVLTSAVAMAGFRIALWLGLEG